MLRNLVVTFAILSCPPELPTFPVDRETTDGITHTVGQRISECCTTTVDYRDNRTVADGFFFSKGIASLGAHLPPLGQRMIRYRMDVDLPEGGQYSIINNMDPTDEDHYVDICITGGKVIAYVEGIFNYGEFRSYQWDFEVYMDPAGDITGNGIVDGEDLGILLGDWGRTDGPASDLNDDGIVDGLDLGILFADWGEID